MFFAKITISLAFVVKRFIQQIFLVRLWEGGPVENNCPTDAEQGWAYARTILLPNSGCATGCHLPSPQLCLTDKLRTVLLTFSCVLAGEPCHIHFCSWPCRTWPSQPVKSFTLWLLAVWSSLAHPREGLQTKRGQSLTQGREGRPVACYGWWHCPGGPWDDMKSVSLLFSLSFQGEMTGKESQRCFDGWSWSLLPPGTFWLAGLATTVSKSVLHLSYFSSPTCHFLSHLSLPFPSPFHSILCAPRELSMCMRHAWMTWSFLRLLCERFQPLHGAGERWQEDWPLPKTSAGSCTAGLYQPLGLRQETQKLPTCRTLTQTLWHKTCWQILPFEWVIDLCSQHRSAT